MSRSDPVTFDNRAAGTGEPAADGLILNIPQKQR